MDGSKSVLFVVVSIFNAVSLVASVVLLVGISFEVTGSRDAVFSQWYSSLQLVVCSIFFVTALFRLVEREYRRQHWLRDTIFAIASLPYMDVLRWSGAEVSNPQMRVLAFAPIIVSVMATVVIIEWLVEGRRRRLMAAYVVTVVMFTYISALLFYDCEIGVNSSLKSFGDALWWAGMNVTTVGAEIFPVTTTGKIICVILPVVGMMFFPIFTVYISEYYEKKRPA